MSIKQDRSPVRTAKDLEQKYSFGKSFSEVRKSVEVATNAAEQAEKSARKAQSEVLQLSDSISLTVENGVSTAQIKLKVGDKEIPATIDMKGLVTFSNLREADGTTVINGSNIKTGEILADLIKAGVIKSKDGSLVIDLDNNTASITGTFKTLNSYDSSNSIVHGELDNDGLRFIRDSDAQKFAYFEQYGFGLSNFSGYLEFENLYDPATSMRFDMKKNDAGQMSLEIIPPMEDWLNGGMTQPFLEHTWKNLGNNAEIRLVISSARSYITGLSAPQDNTDAVNKQYVDNQIAALKAQLGL